MALNKIQQKKIDRIRKAANAAANKVITKPIVNQLTKAQKKKQANGGASNHF